MNNTRFFAALQGGFTKLVPHFVGIENSPKHQNLIGFNNFLENNLIFISFGLGVWIQVKPIAYGKENM